MSRRSSKPRLSHGGRHEGLLDGIELVVARRVGRTLSRTEGFLVQMTALLMISFAIWLLWATGIIPGVAQAFGRWYASQIHLGPSPKP